VLEVDGEQPDHLHGDPGGARDTDGGVAVGDEHLLDVPLRDHVARGGPPVAGDQHSAGERQRDDRGAVPDVRAEGGNANIAATVTHALGQPPGQQVRAVVATKSENEDSPG